MAARRKGIVKEFGIDMYTPLCLICITKCVLYSTANSVQSYVAAWMGG